jgi:PKD repeat protein
MLSAWLGSAASAQAASSGPGLTYFGGPVVHAINVYLVEWGSFVNPTYTDATNGDPGFFEYLSSQSGSTTGIGGVLAQYMDTTDTNSKNRVGYGGEIQVSPSVGAMPPATVSDSSIRAELARDIDAGALPAPLGTGLSTIYVVLFPPNDNVCLGNTCAFSHNGFCAYHSSFVLNGAGPQVLYAAMVDNGAGTPNAGLCAAKGSSDLATQTEDLSHEFAETINDPLVAESGNSFGPPLAWYNPSLGEIGDICVSAGDQAANGPWVVQTIWSNIDSACVAGESAYAAPTAAFVASSTATAGQPAAFNASASSDPAGDAASASYSPTTFSIGSGIASYAWNWGDGSPDTTIPSATAAHTYANPGNYQVSVTVTDNLGFTSTYTQAISVAAPAPITTPSPRPRASRPAASTGPASKIRSSGATVSGTVNPRGSATSYLVEFGRSTAYGHSTVATPAGSGTTGVHVRVVLAGLHPNATYHYRVVATNAGGTVVGADRSFKTLHAPATAPRFSFRVLGRATVASALSTGLEVRFTCSRACVAQFAATLASAPSARALGLTVARGFGRARAAGAARATLRFSSRARTRLGGAHAISLVISGYAVSRGSAQTAPQLVRLTLS